MVKKKTATRAIYPSKKDAHRWGPVRHSGAVADPEVKTNQLRPHQQDYAITLLQDLSPFPFPHQ